MTEKPGPVTGYGGDPESDAAFVDKVREANDQETAAGVSRAIDAPAIWEQTAAAVEPLRDELAAAFRQEDEIDAEAQAAVDRVRLSERIRRRFDEKLDDDLT